LTETCRKLNWLRVFDNRVLKKTAGPKWEDVSGEWREQHNEICMICILWEILLEWTRQGEWNWWRQEKSMDSFVWKTWRNKSSCKTLE